MARWQPRQAFAQAVTSEERPFKTYLEEMRRRVARLPGTLSLAWEGAVMMPLQGKGKEEATERIIRSERTRSVRTETGRKQGKNRKSKNRNRKKTGRTKEE